VQSNRLERKPPRDLIRKITYGEKDIVECFKAIIRAKLQDNIENHFSDVQN
jgi:hypothetical protein